MPVYVYECRVCNETSELVRPVAQRKAPVHCACGKLMRRTVESFRARTFEPYYDEGLDSDVYGYEDRRSLMRQRGVEEIGDKVHGGRNYDSKAPVKMEKQELKGKRPKVFAEKDFQVETVDELGQTVSSGAFSELEDVSDTKSSMTFDEAFQITLGESS